MTIAESTGSSKNNRITKIAGGTQLTVFTSVPHLTVTHQLVFICYLTRISMTVFSSWAGARLTVHQDTIVERTDKTVIALLTVWTSL